MKQTEEVEDLVIVESSDYYSRNIINTLMKYFFSVTLLFFGLQLLAQGDSIAVSNRQKASAMYIDALKYKLLEDYEKARPLFEQILVLDNTNTQAIFELGMINAKTGRYNEAFENFDIVISREPQNTHYLESILDVYTAFKLHDAQIETLRKLIQLKPNSSEYYYSLSDIYRQKGDLKKSVSVLESLFELNKADVNLILKIASIYEVSGNTKKAASRLETFLADNASNPNVEARLIDLYLKSGDEKAARKLADKNKDKIYAMGWSIPFSFAEYYISKKNSKEAQHFILQGLNNQSIDKATKLSVYQIFSEKLEEAGYGLQSDVQKAITNNMVSQFPDDARVVLNHTEILNTDNRFYESLPFLENALKTDSINYRLLDRYMWTLLAARQYDKLLITADRVLKIYPLSAIPYYHKGFAYYNLKDYDKSIAAFERALTDLGNFEDIVFIIHSVLGDLYWQKKDSESSFRHYDKALLIKPDDNSVLNNYAYWLSLENKRLDEALLMSRKTIESAPKNSTFLDTYAWVLYKSGNYNEALRYQEKALKYAESPSGVMLEHLGDIYFRLGNKAKAIEMWSKASKQDEVSELLKVKLETGELHE